MLLGLLGVILVSAKIFGYTQLSWLVVTSPFWVPIAFAIAVFVLGVLLMAFTGH